MAEVIKDIDLERQVAVEAPDGITYTPFDAALYVVKAAGSPT